MIERIKTFFSRSFYRKLLLFNVSMVFLTAVALFLYLTNNFRTITDFSLAQNSQGIEATTLDYLDKYTHEKADLTWLQLQAAQDNLAVLGRTAQKIVDHSAELEAETAVFDLSIFQTELHEEMETLTTDTDAPVDAFIPPEIADNPRAVELLKTSALLNLSLDAIYQGNPNNAFIYYVGDEEAPVTRAYPNYHLVEILGEEGLDNLFWRDYFAPNVSGWEQWYTDAALQERIPNPITVEPPYNDAAGQGLILTMFYPLWDHEADAFAGAVAADIILNQIIENVLSIQVAQTGFAFLMNGKGEIIAMPEEGYRLLDIDVDETELGSLSYFTGAIADSGETAVQKMAVDMLENDKGIHRLTLGDGSPNLISFESLPSLSDNQYQEDRWRIGILVPEDEIFDVLNQTDAAIRTKSAGISAISLALAALFLLVATGVTMRFSNSVTRDLRTLAQAAKQVSGKNYDVELDIKSSDEIGQLGHAFDSMIHDIHDYTANLETKVSERTADLQQANEQISLLNEQLKDENIRLGAELDVARQIQMMVLPPESETVAIDNLDIACYMQPADEVGGDYYDVLRIGDSVIIGIGDVTGHGLPAGIIMLMAQTALLTLSQNGEQDMEQMLAVLNRVIYQNIMRIRDNKSMTLAALRYQDRQFDLVGQHESVIICRGDGRIEEIDTMDLGFPIGLEQDIDDFIMSVQFQLEPTDTLLLYTDGITEAENETGEMFTLDRLKEALAQYHQLDAKDMMERILADVYAYIGETHIYDDISIVIIKQE
ncbi:MAG: SpoIIE family protein phosphatase [Chloroflexi bacterium]|nr:SpoIIE family protein phosphatase [Chloroflexota bacterium]